MGKVRAVIFGGHQLCDEILVNGKIEKLAAYFDGDHYIKSFCTNLPDISFSHPVII